jgi:hypothetical protein
VQGQPLKVPIERGRELSRAVDGAMGGYRSMGKARDRQYFDLMRFGLTLLGFGSLCRLIFAFGGCFTFFAID